MAINFFTHPDLPRLNEELKPLTQNLRTGDTIKALHTPIVLPLGTSNEIGGYARSLGFPFFGPKRIAIDCDRLAEEYCNSMKKFILARQVALFDKSSRYLHLPLGVIAVATAAVASSILFPSSMLAMVTIPAIVGLASAAIVAKRERENEFYADLRAFRNCEEYDKLNILTHFLDESYYQTTIWNEDQAEDGLLKRPERSVIQNIFSGYPSAIDRYARLSFELRRQNETVTPEDRNLLIAHQLGQGILL